VGSPGYRTIHCRSLLDCAASSRAILLSRFLISRLASDRYRQPVSGAPPWKLQGAVHPAATPLSAVFPWVGAALPGVLVVRPSHLSSWVPLHQRPRSSSSKRRTCVFFVTSSGTGSSPKRMTTFGPSGRIRSSKRETRVMIPCAFIVCSLQVPPPALPVLLPPPAQGSPTDAAGFRRASVPLRPSCQQSTQR